MSLPKGFKRLEYIQSSGTQYVDTNVLAVSGYAATVDFQATYVPYSGQSWILAEYDKTGDWRCGLYNGSFYTSGGFTYNQTATKTARTVAAGSCTKTIPYPMYLFAQSEGGSSAHLSNSQYKLYSCQIWDNNGTLVRDFIPCQNADGAVGLWDAVNEEFYANAGTGTFTAGPVVPETVDENEITELEYIESSGTQYMNSGFYPTGKTRAVVDFKMVNQAGEQQGIFGSRPGTSGRFTVFTGTSAARLQVDYNTQFGLANSESTISGLNVNERTLLDVSSRLSVNGVKINEVSAASFTSAYTLYLFANNNAGTAQLPGSLFLYACQIYDNGLLERDYIPAMLTNGEVGLYDRVFHEFYRNAGTGEFIAGPEVQTVPKAPANFRVESETDTLVTLAWDPGEDAMGYRLYRQGQLLADITENSVSVEVEPFAGAVFTLTAYNENGEGAGAELTYFNAPDDPILFLVTYRTQQDVTERNPKGYYAASDLNRVGYAVEYLAGRLKESGVTVTVSPVLTWTDMDWGTPTAMKAYLADVQTMRGALKLAESTPTVPEDMEKLTYTEANQIEMILLALDTHIKNMLMTLDAGWALGLAYTGLYAKEAYR